MMVLVAAVMVVLLGMTGLAIDSGRLLMTYRALQATSDDAALAGAITLPASNTTALANQYSSVAGNKNVRALLSGATMVSGYPVVKCLSSLQSLGYVCNSPAGGNAVQVKQQITVPVPFMRVLGYQQITLATISTARTGLIDVSSGLTTYLVYSSPNNAYNGYVVNTSNANLPGAWINPTSHGYTNSDTTWIIPPGGSGSANYSYPTGTYVYVSGAVTGVTAITQGMVNADDSVTIYLYDLTTGSPVQVGGTFASSGDCSTGNGGYCNAPLTFSYSGLSVNHTYRLAASVENSGGGPTGLLIQAKGYSPAALYRDQ